MSTLNYFSNFDDSPFQQTNVREFNRLKDDPCDIEQRNTSNEQKLKYMTNNYNDLIEAKDKLNFYGMTIKDQLFVPSEKVDQYSFLVSGVENNILTNCRVKNEFGQLPLPTIPARYQSAHGNVDIEDTMGRLFEPHHNPCLSRDTEYYKRSFYIFNDPNIETPQAIKSVETDAFGPRGGESTRFSECDIQNP